MGAGADGGKCSGNVALGARNGDAGCMAGNLAVVIFTSAISNQGCVLCCRDSPTYLLAIRSRFPVVSFIPAQPVLASKQFVVGFLPDLPSASLVQVGLGIGLESGASGCRPE
jgi:hypothetical protein